MNVDEELHPGGSTPGADEAVWCSLRHIHLAVSRELDAALRASHRLPLGEYELLRALASPSCARRMAGLAVMVGLSPSGLTRAIERLERRGLVRRLPCPADRRGASAELSDAGRGVLHHATVTHDAALHTLLLNVLSPAEGELLLQLRSRVVGTDADGFPHGRDLPPGLPEEPGACDRLPNFPTPISTDLSGESMDDRNAFNAQVIEAFRTQSGVAPDQVGEMPLLLLTTTGAKSGQPRVAPLAYIEDGDRLVVVASKGGSPAHPDWYHNIVSTPQVTVEVGAEKFPARADITLEPERTRLFRAAAEAFPRLGEHEQSTARVIPVITLTRV